MIVGYRSWRVSPAGKLLSYFKFDPWESREIVADCLTGTCGPGCAHQHGKNDREASPHKDGCCGIYAYKFPAMYDASSFSFEVMGAVLLSGKIIEHDIGYRAEKAKIEILFYPWHKDGVILEQDARTWSVSINSQETTTIDKVLATVRSNYNVPISDEKVEGIKFFAWEYLERFGHLR